MHKLFTRITALILVFSLVGADPSWAAALSSPSPSLSLENKQDTYSSQALVAGMVIAWKAGAFSAHLYRPIIEAIRAHPTLSLVSAAAVIITGLSTAILPSLSKVPVKSELIGSKTPRRVKWRLALQEKFNIFKLAPFDSRWHLGGVYVGFSLIVGGMIWLAEIIKVGQVAPFLILVGGMLLVQQLNGYRIRMREQLNGVTKLPNVVPFDIALDAWFKRAEGGNPDAANRRAPLFLFYLDMTGLKGYNEDPSAGGSMAAGDEALRNVAEILKDVARDWDKNVDVMVSHFGGDEFAIIARLKDSATAVELAKRIYEHPRLSPIIVQDPRNKKKKIISGQLRIGIAGSRSAANTVELKDHADWALRESKKLGKKNGTRPSSLTPAVNQNTIVVYPETETGETSSIADGASQKQSPDEDLHARAKDSFLVSGILGIVMAALQLKFHHSGDMGPLLTLFFAQAISLAIGEFFLSQENVSVVKLKREKGRLSFKWHPEIEKLPVVFRFFVQILYAPVLLHETAHWVFVKIWGKKLSGLQHELLAYTAQGLALWGLSHLLPIGVLLTAASAPVIVYVAGLVILGAILGIRSLSDRARKKKKSKAKTSFPWAEGSSKWKLGRGKVIALAVGSILSLSLLFVMSHTVAKQSFSIGPKPSLTVKQQQDKALGDIVHVYNLEGAGLALFKELKEKPTPMTSEQVWHEMEKLSTDSTAGSIEKLKHPHTAYEKSEQARHNKVPGFSLSVIQPLQHDLAQWAANRVAGNDPIEAQDILDRMAAIMQIETVKFDATSVGRSKEEGLMEVKPAVINDHLWDADEKGPDGMRLGNFNGIIESHNLLGGAKIVKELKNNFAHAYPNMPPEQRIPLELMAYNLGQGGTQELLRFYGVYSTRDGLSSNSQATFNYDAFLNYLSKNEAQIRQHTWEHINQDRPFENTQQAYSYGEFTWRAYRFFRSLHATASTSSDETLHSGAGHMKAFAFKDHAIGFPALGFISFFRRRRSQEKSTNDVPEQRSIFSAA